jgi:aminopeptidase
LSDPRVNKLAQVLVNYSLDIQPGNQFLLMGGPLAEELTLAVYREALSRGAHIFVRPDLPGQMELFYKYASPEQLDYVSPVERLFAETFDASLYIGADHNTRELAGVDPASQSRARKARAELSQIEMERSARGELHWCYTVYPTNAAAQEADMSLLEYQDFVYGAGLLDLEDPVAAWRQEGERQRAIIAWLEGRDQVVMRGENLDLRFSIKGRPFEEACGRMNFPDGEVYTSPVEDSVDGWIRFSYPAIFGGQEVEDIELWFEDGKVVKEKASKGQKLLTALLDTDQGARYLGEWGIGTNYQIQRFTKNMLFDEKIGGTIHLAVGMGFPEVGGQNRSGVHWDMLCDMGESEISVDGEVFYRDGKVVV